MLIKLFSSLVLVFFRGADHCNVSVLMIMDLCFLVLCALESVNRWRLSAIKVLSKLELHFGNGSKHFLDPKTPIFNDFSSWSSYPIMRVKIENAVFGVELPTGGTQLP